MCMHTIRIGTHTRSQTHGKEVFGPQSMPTTSKYMPEKNAHKTKKNTKKLNKQMGKFVQQTTRLVTAHI